MAERSPLYCSHKSDCKGSPWTTIAEWRETCVNVPLGGGAEKTLHKMTQNHPEVFDLIHDLAMCSDSHCMEFIECVRTV